MLTASWHQLLQQTDQSYLCISIMATDKQIVQQYPRHTLTDHSLGKALSNEHKAKERAI